MVAKEEFNGWPELPASMPSLPKLEARPSPLELAQAYATLAVHHGQLWTRVVGALEYLRGHLIRAKGDAARAHEKAASAHDEIEKLKKQLKLEPADPVRPEAPSQLDILESVTAKVSGEFEKIAKETAGSKVEAEPSRLSGLVERAVAEELAKQEAQRRAVQNAERLAAFEKAEADRRKLIKKAVVAFVLALAGAGGTWTWGKAQGKIEGVAEEGKRHSQVAPSAPAAVAPAK